MVSDPLGQMLEWAHALRFEDLPPKVRAASTAYFANTVAAIIGGSAAPGAVQAARIVRRWCGAEEATVAGHAFKAPAPSAAFANGVMAHALDYDDTQVGTGFHPNASLVPALVAAAETSPHASGRDLICAHVAGLEFGCRMTLAARNRPAHPWLSTTLFGVFGSTVAVGKIGAFEEARLRHAVGIAYSSAGGNRQGLLDGALIQRVQPGLSAQAAVLACALAAEGVTGAHAVFDGFYGLYPSYYGSDFDADVLTAGLGQDFRMLDIALKNYPCCSYSQEPIEGAMELMREHPLRAEDVEKIIVSFGSEHAARLVDHPYEPGAEPQVQAQFSIQYQIASAILRGRFCMEDLQDGHLQDPGTIAFGRRVHVAVEPERAGQVEIRLKNGKKRTRNVRLAKGHPARPLSEIEMIGKMRECGRHAARPRAPEECERLYRLTIALADEQRASALGAALA